MSDLVSVTVDLEAAKSYSKDEIRHFISALEEQIKDAPQVEIPVIHHFSKSVYAREMRVTKGSLIIGKIHKFQSMNILSQGEASVLSIDGVMKVRAPFTFVSSPGAKRVIIAHEDCVWTTIHGTDETDVEKIEENFIAKNYAEVMELETAAVIEIEGK